MGTGDREGSAVAVMETTWSSSGRQEPHPRKNSGGNPFPNQHNPAPALPPDLPRNPPECDLGGEGGPSLWTWILQKVGEGSFSLTPVTSTCQRDAKGEDEIPQK